MAPRPTHDTPAEQLSALGRDARARGLSFEEWWTEALRPGEPIVMVNHPDPPSGAILWPTTTREIRDWREAIEAMREVWRRSYERVPATRSDDAVAVLAGEVALPAGRELQPA